MTQTLTTERLREIAERRSPSLRWGEAEKIAAELLANREAQPVYQCRFFTTDVDGKQIGEWQDMDKGFYDQYDPCCRRVLYTAPPAPAVPELITEDEQEEAVSDGYADSFRGGWNACRAAMLAQPVSQGYKLPEGFKLMPLEMTDEIGEAIAAEARCCGGIALDIYEAALAAAPEGVK